MPLRSLEPYYVRPEHQWSRLLAGRRVAVVSSFADTMQRQIWKAGTIWANEELAGLLPADQVAEWTFVRTGYAPATALGAAGWPEGINTWQRAVAYVVRRVVQSGADVALVGCGGLGTIIGSILKGYGISTIVLGGAIQVLFGIKGARWQRHEVISRFWNAAWVWPAADEIPKGAAMVEGSCYWAQGTG
jgi:hypothetical protein